ncbi:unnamed protein product [Effrenium voratum]|nr:unnamed protein product [Effrenium voratum]
MATRSGGWRPPANATSFSFGPWVTCHCAHGVVEEPEMRIHHDEEIRPSPPPKLRMSGGLDTKVSAPMPERKSQVQLPEEAIRDREDRRSLQESKGKGAAFAPARRSGRLAEIEWGHRRKTRGRGGSAQVRLCTEGGYRPACAGGSQRFARPCRRHSSFQAAVQRVGGPYLPPGQRVPPGRRGSKLQVQHVWRLLLGAAAGGGGRRLVQAESALALALLLVALAGPVWLALRYPAAKAAREELQDGTCHLGDVADTATVRWSLAPAVRCGAAKREGEDTATPLTFAFPAKWWQLRYHHLSCDQLLASYRKTSFPCAGSAGESFEGHKADLPPWLLELWLVQSRHPEAVEVWCFSAVAGPALLLLLALSSRCRREVKPEDYQRLGLPGLVLRAPKNWKNPRALDGVAREVECDCRGCERDSHDFWTSTSMVSIRGASRLIDALRQRPHSHIRGRWQ